MLAATQWAINELSIFLHRCNTRDDNADVPERELARLLHPTEAMRRCVDHVIRVSVGERASTVF